MELSLHPYPEVFLLGAMRSGTSFLHDALTHHRDIVGAAHKELQFFSLHWSRGPAFYRAQLPLRWPWWIYASARARRPMLMDSSPYYLFHPQAPARLEQLLGTRIKCIVLLRDPVDRAWSHYRMMLASGREHLGFVEALDREAERIRAPYMPDPTDPHALPPHLTYSYVSRGRYAEQLENWWRHIPRERFLLLKSEDLFAAPDAVLARVCRFLGVEEMSMPAGLRRNEAGGAALPAAVRSRLQAVFREPDRRLLELTGIGWERGAVVPSRDCIDRSQACSP